MPKHSNLRALRRWELLWNVLNLSNQQDIRATTLRQCRFYVQVSMKRWKSGLSIYHNSLPYCHEITFIIRVYSPISCIPMASKTIFLKVLSNSYRSTTVRKCVLARELICFSIEHIHPIIFQEKIFDPRHERLRFSFVPEQHPQLLFLFIRRYNNFMR